MDFSFTNRIEKSTTSKKGVSSNLFFSENVKKDILAFSSVIDHPELTLVTSDGDHNLLTGEKIFIQDTINYNGFHVVEVISSDTFIIKFLFTFNEIGNFYRTTIRQNEKYMCELFIEKTIVASGEVLYDTDLYIIVNDENIIFDFMDVPEEDFETPSCIKYYLDESKTLFVDVIEESTTEIKIEISGTILLGI